MRIAKAGIVGLGVIAALTVSVPGFAGGNKYGDVSETQTCKSTTGTDADTVNWVGPQKLWPPNHKFVDESITAVANTTTPSENVKLTVTPRVEDVAGGDGGPQHDPDWMSTNFMGMGANSAQVDFQLRAERSGKGDGRDYYVDWSASFDNGTNTCSSTDGKDGHHPFHVTVPHDMRPGNR